MISFAFFKYFDAFELDVNVVNFVYYGKTRMCTDVAIVMECQLSSLLEYVFVIFRHQIYSDIFLLYLTVLFYDPVIIHFLVRFTTYFGFDL